MELLTHFGNNKPAATLTTTASLYSSTPTISQLDIAQIPSSSIQQQQQQQIALQQQSISTTSEFLQKLGASLIKSIQLQQFPKQDSAESSLIGSLSSSTSSPSYDSALTNMDFESISQNQIILDNIHSSGSALNTLGSNTASLTAFDDLTQQLEYDKFMNEVWIGVVLLLIFISMIFCFCSCFLYHQFRIWKRNYHNQVPQVDDESSIKISLDGEDPVPEYTLVSGLPSYEAALELLNKTPQSCLIVHPSVFQIFNKNEKLENTANNTETTDSAAVPLLQQQQQLADSSATTTVDSAQKKSCTPLVLTLPSYSEAMALPSSNSTTPATPASAGFVSNTATVNHHSLASFMSIVNEKSSLKLENESQSAQCAKTTTEKTEKS